jgi:quercetin dioxygenase-like cupin family protein
VGVLPPEPLLEASASDQDCPPRKPLLVRPEQGRQYCEHAKPEDRIFYVLAGTLSLCLDGEWMDAPRGSYAVIPGGIAHDFENRGADLAAS